MEKFSCMVMTLTCFNQLERIQLSFAHSLLRLRSTTPNSVVLQELGLSSLVHFCEYRLASFGIGRAGCLGQLCALVDVDAEAQLPAL